MRWIFSHDYTFEWFYIYADPSFFRSSWKWQNNQAQQLFRSTQLCGFVRITTFVFQPMRSGNACFDIPVILSLITRFMGPTWSQSGADRTQVNSMLAPWTLLSWILVHKAYVTFYKNDTMWWWTLIWSIILLCVVQKHTWSHCISSNLYM